MATRAQRSAHRKPVCAPALCDYYLSMSLAESLAARLDTSSREQTMRTLAVRAGVGLSTARRALDGRSMHAASARKIAAALAELGIEVNAGDIALGTGDAE